MYKGWPLDGFLALAGVALGYWLTVLRDKRVENQERRRLAASLRAEMKTLLDRYDKVFGQYIRNLPPGQPLSMIGAAVQSQDFFAVFDHNADKLGLFNPVDAETVIRAYVLGKAHAESLSQTMRQMELLSNRIFMVAGTPMAAQLNQQLQQLSVYAANLLRTESADVVAAGEKAITVLRTYI